jgi:hypothetical protein
MKMKNLRLTILFYLACFPALLWAQADTAQQKADAVWAIYPSFSYQWPGGDMADRFGQSSTIGPGFFHKTASNWIFNADVNFIFGNTINQDSLINNLINADGFVTSDEGLIADITFFERGFYTTARVGKLIPLSKKNRNSGLVIMAGVGYMQHKIKIEVQQNIVASLDGDYKKGYDRFSDGFSTAQFVGYMHIGRTRLANFFVGLEFAQAWTKNRRSMDFDTMRRDDSQRLDLLTGIRVAWLIPFSRRQPDPFYFF